MMIDRQFNDEQGEAAVALVERLPWGDIDALILCLELTLRLALEATTDAHRLWRTEGEERFGDWTGVSADDIATFTDEWRLAYVAELLYHLALAYGVSIPRMSNPLPGHHDSCSPAALLRGLNDLAMLGFLPRELDRHDA